MRLLKFSICFLICLSLKAAEPSEADSLAGWFPAVYKASEAVVLVRNPLHASETAHAGVFEVNAAKGLTSSKVVEAVRHEVRGLVCSGTHPCVLFGGRIVEIGQELELVVDDAGTKKRLRLRLRSVQPELLGFVTDDSGARLLGTEEWSCPLHKERH